MKFFSKLAKKNAIRCVIFRLINLPLPPETKTFYTMKNLKLFAIVVLASLAFVACQKETPEAVAKKFLGHLQKKEYDEAKKLGTEATGKFLDMMKSLEQMGGAAAETPETAPAENLKCTVDGDTAVCTYTQNGEEQKLDLVKQDGKWLVNMSKEDSMGGTEDMNLDMEEEAPADSVETATEEVVE